MKDRPPLVRHLLRNCLLKVTGNFYFFYARCICYVNVISPITTHKEQTIWTTRVTGFLLGIFFRGGKIYCCTNFICYAIVFGPNLREGQKFSGWANCLRGAPPAPLWKKASVISICLLKVKLRKADPIRDT